MTNIKYITTNCEPNPHPQRYLTCIGGVAKTTLTQNLGYHLAQKKKNRVLLVDIDPQASLTTFMGLEPDELETSIHASIVEGKPLPIMPELIHGMSLVPADINLAASEMQLAGAIAREYRLKNALVTVQDNYDIYRYSQLSLARR